MQIFILALLVMASGLFKGDEKVMKQLDLQIKNSDFKKAAVLLDKISIEGRSSTRYLQYAALINDSLSEYLKAAAFYDELQKLEPAQQYSSRIAWLKEEKLKSDEAERVRLEKMKNCAKCKGTGYFEETGICSSCNGFKRINKDCNTCHGQGFTRCNNCDGSGRIQSSSSDRNTTVTCGRCLGRGSLPCNGMCANGKVLEDCRKCKGTGNAIERIKCDLH